MHNDTNENNWSFEWEKWIEEFNTIHCNHPYFLAEPKEFSINADYIDLLIIKELEIDGTTSLVKMSEKLGINLSTIKYHYYNHVKKRKLIISEQIEFYRFPFLVSDNFFFKLEFNSYNNMCKFALFLSNKPFSILMAKIDGEKSLVVHTHFPKWEFRRFIDFLSIMINNQTLSNYVYYSQDLFQVWRETIPYEHFRNRKWNYDNEIYFHRMHL